MELNSWSTYLLLLVLYISYTQVASLHSHYFSKVPRIGNTWLNFILRSAKTGKQSIQDAYYQYSMKSLPFRTNANTYILPPSTFAEARKLPSTVLNSVLANEEILVVRDILGQDHWDVINFIRQDVSRSLDSMIPGLAEEIKFVLPATLAPPGSKSVKQDGHTWYQMQIHPEVLTAVGRVVTRVFVGKKFSKNEHFTRNVSDYAHGVAVQSFFLQKVPRVILPYLVPFLSTYRRMKMLVPIIKPEIIKYIHQREEDYDPDSQEPLLFQKLVRYVKAEPNFEGADDEVIFESVRSRLFGLFFAAIDTSSMTFTHLAFDIVGHPKSEYVDPMNAEIKEVLARHGGKWSVKALGELRLLDSFVKESQRLHPLSLTLGTRKVMTSGGITLKPDIPHAKPIHLPEGALTSMPVWGVHSDPDVYPNPYQFQGFRFAKDAVPSSQPNDKFISFGHGRHACPGRHLALILVKLMAIEFLKNYDWQVIERPQDWNMGTILMPDLQRKISIRLL